MFTKTTAAALTAAAATLAPGFASANSVAAPGVPSQYFLSSEVVAQADVSTPDYVRTAVGLGVNGNATDSTTGGGGFAGAIANIQSLFLGDLLHLAGTSRSQTVGSSASPAFYHEVRTTIDAAKTTIYSLFVASGVTDADFDRELISSLQITDAGGNQVDISAELAALNADPNARLLEIELAPGTYQTFVGTGSGARADGEYQLRSTVVAAPTPSAALAGLMGLGALTRRRRKQA